MEFVTRSTGGPAWGAPHGGHPVYSRQKPVFPVWNAGSESHCDQTHGR